MSTLDKLLESVKSSISDHVSQQSHTGFSAGGLLDKITDLFGQHKQQAESGNRNIKPASQDPYGDPGATGNGSSNGAAGRNIKPASQDPYGDPADEKRR